MGFTDYVDVFHGNFENDLPEPKGVAAAWFFLKAQTGNTHPGALLPFGAPSVCPYTGGYPTGYSPYWINSCARPERIMDPAKMSAAGFSHFHQSGTGSGIGAYYNYFILTPAAGDSPPGRFAMFPLENEKGSPGFYSCTLGGIPVSAAAGRMSCCYRIVFPSGGGTLVCDPEVNGIFRDGKCRATMGRVVYFEKSDDHAAYIIQYDLPLSVYLRCPGAKSMSVLSDGRLAIKFDAGETELSLGFSFNNFFNAKTNAANIAGFEEIRRGAKTEWERLLGAVEIDADAERRGVFYSSLYHSLVKPCDISNDSPLWNDGPSWTDLMTMWDIYKTQFPLVFSLYNNESASLVSSLIRNARLLGFYPNQLYLSPLVSAGSSQPRTLVSSGSSASTQQARALGWHSVYDAFVRGVPADYAEALDLMEEDLNRNHDFTRKGITEPYPSHTWDLTCACFAAGLLARALKKDDKAGMFFRYSKNWPNVLDKSTGLITANGEFYEGSNWNYSFRLLPQTAERIANNKEAFIKNLDAFFGYGAPPVAQVTNRLDMAGMKAGTALNRFEGFNNETDMETPYAYIYANRHDRTAEICRLGMEVMFAPGRGGICGNDDSGGLSSMYICNTIGLFPVSGLPYLFIGSPGIKESRLRLGNGNVFTVRSNNYSRENLYVKKAALNGKPLPRAWLWIEEFMTGGALDLEMTNRPEAWDIEPPPALG